MFCYHCMNLCTHTVCEHCGFDPSSYVDLPVALRPGTTLKENYILGYVIGSGGFGITYIGYDNRNSRRVAIKEFFPSSVVQRDPAQTNEVCVLANMDRVYQTGVKKFYLEASILSRVQYVPAIVKVYDFFYENNTAYIVMEYIDGTSIDKIVKNQGPLEIDMVLTIYYPILEVLKAVHAEGILHRDIAPNNVLLDERFRARLIDFGASRAYSHQLSSDMTIILKSGFAPVEQYTRREHHSPAEDIYALSASMYYTLTGKIPPEATERLAFDTLKPFSAYGASVPEAIGNVILKGLAVRVEERYGSAEEMMLAIDQALSVPAVLPDTEAALPERKTERPEKPSGRTKKSGEKTSSVRSGNLPYLLAIVVCGALFLVMLILLASLLLG